MPATADDLFDSDFLQRLEYLRIVARRAFAGSVPGGRTGRRTGPGLEFAEHRAYSPGDDFRHIDWAAFGRLERLLLRLCQQEEDLAIYFLVDASASMATGRPPKFDHARRLAAALAYVGLASLERVRLVAVDGGVRGHLEAGRGKTHILGVLDFLRGLAAGGRTDLARAVEAFLPHAPQSGLAVLVSDFLDPAGYEKPLTTLQGNGFDVWCLQVTDPEDLAPPGLGDLAVADAETGDVLGIHLTDEVRGRLAREAERFAADMRAWCLARGIGYAEAPTRVPADVLVTDVLRRGGLLA
ncbi:MAG TPA: DUF58 domain-containing protein [Phycisphaerae bacterium]|nr:DUF58 domain-containing protein [Phycisphaerae bacterium]